VLIFQKPDRAPLGVLCCFGWAAAAAQHPRLDCARSRVSILVGSSRCGLSCTLKLKSGEWRKSKMLGRSSRGALQSPFRAIDPRVTELGMMMQTTCTSLAWASDPDPASQKSQKHTFGCLADARLALEPFRKARRHGSALDALQFDSASPAPLPRPLLVRIALRHHLHPV
jgi:hypothetical protein